MVNSESTFARPIPPVVIGLTGASGAIIGREMVDTLLDLEIPVVAVASNGARMVWQEELDEPFNHTVARWVENSSLQTLRHW